MSDGTRRVKPGFVVVVSEQGGEFTVSAGHRGGALYRLAPNTPTIVRESIGRQLAAQGLTILENVERATYPARIQRAA